MGSIKEDYNSDKEFYDNFSGARKALLLAGWKENKPVIEGEVLTSVFTKNGYSMFVMYGCREDIDNEIL